MARDARLLAQVGDALLPSLQAGNFFSRVLVEKEAWTLPDTETAKALKSLLPAVKSCANQNEEVQVSKEGLDRWTNVFRTIQALEIWEEHGAWIAKERPTFGPGIAERFQMARVAKKENCLEQFNEWASIRQRMEALLADDAILVIPTAPGPAPRLNLQGEKAEKHRAKTMQLTCIAGLAGLPQITMPLAEADGLPVGLSFIAGPNQDKRLLEWAVSLEESCREMGNKR